MSTYSLEPVYGGGRFHGRRTLVRSMLDGINRGRSFMVCGGPRTGRTSLLFELTAQTHQIWQRRPDQPKTVPVYFDVGGAKDAPKLIESLWQAITDAVFEPAVRGGSPGVKPERLQLRRGAAPLQIFEEAAEAYWQGLSGTPAWCRYAILLDNADTLLDRAFDGLIDALLEWVRRDEAWCPTAVIAAGGRSLREQLFDLQSPLRNLRPLFLGSLRTSEAEAMLRTGFPELSSEHFAQLMSAMGRHPALLQQVAVELDSHGAELDLDLAMETVRDNAAALFERIWSEFDLGRGVTYRGAYAAPEHALMQLVIDYPDGVELRVAERELGIAPLKEYAEFLEFAGVVERAMINDFDRLRPHFTMWNDWYNNRLLA